VANVGAIFNMFGAYGDVVCIKILKNKRDCALVQMAKPHHALQVRGLEVRTVEEVAPDSDRLTVVLNRVQLKKKYFFLLQKLQFTYP